MCFIAAALARSYPSGSAPRPLVRRNITVIFSSSYIAFQGIYAVKLHEREGRAVKNVSWTCTGQIASANHLYRTKKAWNVNRRVRIRIYWPLSN